MFARIIWVFLILEIALLGILSGECIQRHHQYNYCKNTDVLKVKLNRGNNDTGPYKMKVKEVFKTTDDIKQYDIVYVDTKYNMDGLTGKHFVVFGNISNGVLWTTSCQGVIRLSTFTTFQMNGFRGYYNQTCECADDIANVEYHESLFCKFKYGARHKYEGACHWNGLNQYRSCKPK